MNYKDNNSGEIISFKKYSSLGKSQQIHFKPTTQDLCEGISNLSLTDSQLKRFENLWWLYGNDGKKCTLFNHKLVQGFYEYKENRIESYREGNKNMVKRFGKEYAEKNGVTDECILACEEILLNP